MIEYDKNLKNELYDIIRESISIGLGKAAAVISELADSHVNLSTTKVYTAGNVQSLPMFSERIIIMKMEGDILHGETVFSMNDEQLIKLIRHLEGLSEMDFTDEEILEIIEDTYQELGNIILGNIISSIVDFFGIRVDINVPYTADKAYLEQMDTNKLLVVDVVFGIDKLDANGKLYLINDYESYMGMASWVLDNM